MEKYMEKLESINYIKKIRELISLGDHINIKARLIHLEQMILEDIERLQPISDTELIEPSEEDQRRELIKLLQKAKQGSLVTSGLTGATFWKFDNDSESRIVNEWIAEIKKLNK
jgi:hypothetical protein